MLRKTLRLLFYKPPVRDCVGYSLRDANGKRLYTGITNNPRAREAEHRLDGKRFAYLQVETKLMSRDYAEEWERNSLEGYIDRVGRLPKYNKTATGQYEVRKRPRAPQHQAITTQQMQQNPADSLSPSQNGFIWRVGTKDYGVKPSVLTRVCLVSAAVLSWYAVVSGDAELYFYVLVLAEWGASAWGIDALSVVALLAVFLLGGLLLFVMPLSLLRAAVKYPPGGWMERATYAGCLVSMTLAGLYAAHLFFGLITDLWEGGLWWAGWAHVVVLLAGIGATWRSFLWIKGHSTRLPRCGN